MRATLRLRVGADRARAELCRGTAVRWSGEMAYAGTEGLRDGLAHLLACGSLPDQPSAIHVELDRSLAQLRTLRGLPPVSAAQLRSLVATQSGRFFRRNGKPLVTDAVWENGAGEDRVALAAAVEEPWVEAIAEAARAAGAVLESVRPAGLTPGTRLRLHSQSEQTRRRHDRLLAVKRLGAVAATLWIAAGATLAARVHATRVRIEREIAGLEAPVAALARAGKALDSASRMVQGLARAESDRARALGALAAISSALPDSAFVTALSLDARGTGEVTVVARRSGEVRAALGARPGLPSPQLQGGVVREVMGGREWERFTVTLGAGAGR